MATRYRTNLTFSQRHKYDDLPSPMRLEELSDDLRIGIWNVVREKLMLCQAPVASPYVDPYFSFQGERFVERIIGKCLRRPEEEISTDYAETEAFFREWISAEKFNKVLDLVEILVNDPDGSTLSEKIKKLFEQHGAAYRLDTTQLPHQFFPCASKEQSDATQIAIETLQDSGMSGASTHLRRAASHLNNQQFSDSIANSIKAVESVARLIDQSAKTLGPALDALEGKGILKHTALKEAFKKLYGYASDEKGIRHALTDKDNANVGIDEAVFMFGACASFAAYLTKKHQQLQQRIGGDS